MTVTYDEGVFEELVNLSAYLADDDDEVAQAFLNSCDATFRFLAANRYVGSQREFKNKKLAGVRMWRVKSFVKYLIFYVPTESGIRILHVLHSSTDYNRAFEDE